MQLKHLGLVLACLFGFTTLAAADSLATLQGKFGFDWRSDPARAKCLKLAGQILADLSSNKYHCDLTPKTNTSSGAPARVCTEVKDHKEYLIFDTLKACNDERETQASNE